MCYSTVCTDTGSVSVGKDHKKNKNQNFITASESLSFPPQTKSCLDWLMSEVLFSVFLSDVFVT